MATLTWSKTFSDATYKGTEWQSYSITSSDVLPYNAIISKIEYSVTSYVGRYSKDTSINFRLYAIAIENGPYTTTSYSSSSATTITETINASSKEDGSATSYNFQKGTAQVWRKENARTYCELNNCDFNENLDSTDIFYQNKTIKVKLRLNNSGDSNWTQYITKISVKVTYELQSEPENYEWLKHPSNVKIIPETPAQYTVSWNSAEWSGGSAFVEYRLYCPEINYSDYLYITTNTSVTLNIPFYNKEITIFVEAYEYQTHSYSNRVSNTAIFYSSIWKKKITANDITVKQNNNGTFEISWTPAVLNYNSVEIQYYLFSYQIDGIIFEGEKVDYFAITKNNSVTINIPVYNQDITIFFSTLELYSHSWASDSVAKNANFKPPELSNPVISISPSSGKSTTITITTKSKLTNTDGTISYSLYRGNTQIDNNSKTSYTISEDKFKEWNIEKNIFKVKAVASDLSNTYGSPLSKDSNEVTFTYDLHKTILYYTGDINQGDNGWVECIPHYYTGDISQGDNGWVECIPYYYTGDTSQGEQGWVPCSYT